MRHVEADMQTLAEIKIITLISMHTQRQACVKETTGDWELALATQLVTALNILLENVMWSNIEMTYIWSYMSIKELLT